MLRAVVPASRAATPRGPPKFWRDHARVVIPRSMTQSVRRAAIGQGCEPDDDRSGSTAGTIHGERPKFTIRGEAHECSRCGVRRGLAPGGREARRLRPTRAAASHGTEVMAVAAVAVGLGNRHYCSDEGAYSRSRSPIAWSLGRRALRAAASSDFNSGERSAAVSCSSLRAPAWVSSTP